MISCLYGFFWIFSFWNIICITWALPINTGQDPSTIKDLGNLAAGNYEEWKKCNGFNCKAWDGPEQELREIKCMLGDLEACQKRNTDTKDLVQEDTVEGDIFLSPNQVHEYAKSLVSKKRKRRKVQIFNQESKKWSLPIKYKFDQTYDKNQTAKTYIRNAIRHWEEKTCIRFQEVHQLAYITGPHIVFTSGKTCGSFIGQIPVYPQPLQLNADCRQLGTIAHEIGHVIGFWHEHQRSDRDDYVKIHGENAKSEQARKFSLELKGSTSDFVPYDYGSLMHYWAWAFTKQGSKTIEPLDKMYLQTLGQKVGLSFLDAKEANLEYCLGVCKSKLEKPCLYGGYQDPNKCEQCRCPDGLGGTYCEDVAPSVNGKCSEFITLKDGESRTIHSPGYLSSEPYHPNIQCNWIVMAASKDHRIIVKFDGSKVGIFCNKHLPVCFHWIEIKYHQDFSLTGPRICCAGHPKLNLRSEGQQVVITFRANFPSTEEERKGFKLIVTTEKDCGQIPGLVNAEENVQCSDDDTTSTVAPKPTATNNDLNQPPNNGQALPIQNMPPVSTSDEIGKVANSQTTYSLCSKMDLAIVFDESWSPSVYFPYVQQFLTAFVDQLDISEEHVHVGIINFGTSARIEYGLAQLDSKPKVLSYINTLTRQSGSTNVAAAFKILREDFFTKNRGDRNDVDNVCLLIVNSKSNEDEDQTIPEAETLRKQNIHVFALGTSWADEKELNSIAGNPKHVFFQNSVKSLLDANVAGDVYKAMCDIKVNHQVSNPPTVKIMEPIKAMPIKDNSHAFDPNMGENNLIWSCSFEDGDDKPTLCGLQQEKNDDQMDWRLGTGSTSSVSTGPSVAQSGSHYLYIEASGQSAGNNAVIYIPTGNLIGQHCLSFYGHFYGENIGQFSVNLFDDDQEKQLWKIHGNIDNQWHSVEIDINFLGTEKLGIAGSTTGGFAGDMAIDTIVLMKGTCYLNNLLEHSDRYAVH